MILKRALYENDDFDEFDDLDGWSTDDVDADAEEWASIDDAEFFKRSEIEGNRLRGNGSNDKYFGEIKKIINDFFNDKTLSGSIRGDWEEVQSTDALVKNTYIDQNGTRKFVSGTYYIDYKNGKITIDICFDVHNGNYESFSILCDRLGKSGYDIESLWGTVKLTDYMISCFCKNFPKSIKFVPSNEATDKYALYLWQLNNLNTLDNMPVCVYDGRVSMLFNSDFLDIAEIEAYVNQLKIKNKRVICKDLMNNMQRKPSITESLIERKYALTCYLNEAYRSKTFKSLMQDPRNEEIKTFLIQSYNIPIGNIREKEDVRVVGDGYDVYREISKTDKRNDINNRSNTAVDSIISKYNSNLRKTQALRIFTDNSGAITMVAIISKRDSGDSFRPIVIREKGEIVTSLAKIENIIKTRKDRWNKICNASQLYTKFGIDNMSVIKSKDTMAKESQFGDALIRMLTQLVYYGLYVTAKKDGFEKFPNTRDKFAKFINDKRDEKGKLKKRSDDEKHKDNKTNTGEYLSVKTKRENVFKKGTALASDGSVDVFGIVAALNGVKRDEVTLKQGTAFYIDSPEGTYVYNIDYLASDNIKVTRDIARKSDADLTLFFNDEFIEYYANFIADYPDLIDEMSARDIVRENLRTPQHETLLSLVGSVDRKSESSVGLYTLINSALFPEKTRKIIDVTTPLTDLIAPVVRRKIKNKLTYKGGDDVGFSKALDFVVNFDGVEKQAIENIKAVDDSGEILRSFMKETKKLKGALITLNNVSRELGGDAQTDVVLEASEILLMFDECYSDIIFASDTEEIITAINKIKELVSSKAFKEYIKPIGNLGHDDVASMAGAIAERNRRKVRRKTYNDNIFYGYVKNLYNILDIVKREYDDMDIDDITKEDIRTFYIENKDYMFNIIDKCVVAINNERNKEYVLSHKEDINEFYDSLMLLLLNDSDKRKFFRDFDTDKSWGRTINQFNGNNRVKALFDTCQLANEMYSVFSKNAMNNMFNSRRRRGDDGSMFTA